MNSPENFVPGGAEALPALHAGIAKIERACPIALYALDAAYHVGPDPRLAAGGIALNGPAQGQDQFEQQMPVADEGKPTESALTIEGAQQLVEDALRAA